MRTIADTIRQLPSPAGFAPLPAPAYTRGSDGPSVMLAVESMKDHTTDEGWAIALALQYAGYQLAGFGLPHNCTHVPAILSSLNPSVVVVQDKREWDLNGPKDFREPRARFHGVEALRDRPDVFKLTILKDAHQRPDYHQQSAAEIGCHAVITYYHPQIVCHLAPYVRPEHLIRTYHTVDRRVVPSFSPDNRAGALLSGAVSSAYPLRRMLFANAHLLSSTTVLPHPGYHRNGCATPGFLKMLSRFRVSICTSSVYGYALRKLIESTACGCRVITDLPSDEVLPHIDGNLVRVPPSITVREMNEIIKSECDRWDAERQAFYASRAVSWYDYRAAGVRLSVDIDNLREHYGEMA